MGGWKSRPKLCRWGRLARAETRGTKQIQSKEEAGRTKRRGERRCKECRDAADSRKYLWLTVGIKLEWELRWTKQKQKEEESINLYRFTVMSNPLTFVTGIIGLLDRNVTLVDTADPVFVSVFRTHTSYRNAVIKSKDLFERKSIDPGRGRFICLIECQWKDHNKHCVSPSLSSSRVPYTTAGHCSTEHTYSDRGK